MNLSCGNVVTQMMTLLSQGYSYEELETTLFYISIDARASVWHKEDRYDGTFNKDEKEYSHSSMLHFICRRPMTNTWFLETKDWITPRSDFPYQEMENISNHDSCWRDSIWTACNTWLNNAANEINKQIPFGMSKHTEYAPNDLWQHSHIHRVCKLRGIVESITERKGNYIRYGASYKIKEVSEIKELNLI